MKNYFLSILLLLCLVLSRLSFAASGIPTFKVIGQDMTSFSILVPQNTTKEQLKALIYEFRNTRKNNKLPSLIPGAAKGGQQLGVIWIFVFSEPDWATTNKLQKFIKSSLKSATDKQFDKEYVKHIKAEYYYSSLGEYGNFGYDDGIVRSPNYKKLF